ncbi:MAG: cysteine sulfinate desulfinase [Myxococcales bacterium SG8_38_1]|nr:MAG: cysteine sulfinate desulfinase [Myxococcales bacterium SG8_38_1]
MTISTPITSAAAPGFDARRVREDFPALHQDVHGKPLVYLDTAATSLKPQSVIDAVDEVYAKDCANIHRAVHLLSQRATARYEEARKKVQAFLNAAKKSEIVFTRGTTEAINLVAQSFGASVLREGDEVLVTELEHHSNIVPWQMLCQRTGAKLVVVPMTDRGEVLRNSFEEKLSDRTKVVALAHVSNALGTVLPVAELIALAHERGAVVLLDGAQAVSHVEVDVQALDCDFYAFSGHKLYGPTGIGVLYGKERLLDAMPPYQGGGDMIRSVTFEETIYNDLPYKFEAGTPNIAGAIGLGAAIDYYQSFDQKAVHAHERRVLEYATDALELLPGVRLIGTAPGKVAALSFLMDAAHPHDIGTIVDSEGVAIRTGHHCAQPVMEHFGIAATARASLGMYNTTDDVDALLSALEKVQELFG